MDSDIDPAGFTCRTQRHTSVFSSNLQPAATHHNSALTDVLTATVTTPRRGTSSPMWLGVICLF